MSRLNQGRGGYASIADKKVTLTANEKPRDLTEKWRMGRKVKNWFYALI